MSIARAGSTASTSALTAPRVAAVIGRCKDRMSDAAASERSESCRVTPSSAAPAASSERE